jgi:hypothetical protein
MDKIYIILAYGNIISEDPEARVRFPALPKKK